MEKVTLERYDEETDTTTTYDLEVSVWCEPNEYVGGFLFSQGGIEIEEVLLDGEEFPVTKQEREKIAEMILKEASVESKHYSKWW